MSHFASCDSNCAGLDVHIGRILNSVILPLEPCFLSKTNSRTLTPQVIAAKYLVLDIVYRTGRIEYRCSSHTDTYSSLILLHYGILPKLWRQKGTVTTKLAYVQSMLPTSFRRRVVDCIRDRRRGDRRIRGSNDFTRRE